MKKISLILFSILMIFSMNVSVLAIQVGSNGESSPVDPPKSDGSTSPNRLTTATLGVSGDWFVGFRMAFVYEDGSVVKTIKSYDYSTMTITKHRNVRSLKNTNNNNGDYSKVTYLTNSSLKSTLYPTSKEDAVTLPYLQKYWLKYSTSNLGLYQSPNNLANILAKYKFNSNYNWYAAGTNLELIKNIFSKDNYKGTNYEQDVIALMSELGVPSTYLTAEKVENLYVTFESTTAVFIYNELYYGTGYELAVLADHLKDNGTLGAKNNCSSHKTALCDLGSALRKRFLCSGYLTEKYFNLQLINEKTIIKTCEGDSNFSNYAYATENYGIGVVVVWLKDFLPQPTYTCSDIHRLAGVSAYDSNNLLTCGESVTNLINRFQIATGNTTITENWYKLNCGCQEEKKGYDCTPTYQTGTCSNSTQISYSDVSSNELDFWNNCVYEVGDYDIDVHKTPTNSAYNYLDTNLTNGNRYCSVYCTEEVQTDFQVITASTSYLAGHHITWPSGTTVSGSRTCKVKIEQSSWNQYEKELNAAVSDTLSSYNKYSEASSRLNVLNTYVQNGTCDTCKEYDTIQPTCYVVVDEPTLTSGTIEYEGKLCKDMFGTNNPENLQGSVQYNGNTYSLHGSVEKAVTTESQTFNIIYDENEDAINKPKTATVTVQEYRLGLYGCTSWEKRYTSNTNSGSYQYYYSSGSSTKISFGYNSSMCESTYNYLKSSVSSTKTSSERQYKQAQFLANSYTNQMQACSTWTDETNKENVYNLNPVVELDNVDTGYPIPDNLKQLDSTVTQDMYTVVNNCKENTDYYYTCDENGCKKIEKTVSNCVPSSNDSESLLVARYEKTITYSLNSGLYRYVTKAEHLSSITIPNESYIYMGYGNIPIAYGTKDGTYDISFNYSKLGHVDNQANNYSSIDRILQNIDVTNYGKWECQYSINSKLIPERPDNAGIDVIYRPIDLKNPFPDIDGAGRLVGSNWCDGTNCNNDNNLIKKVITENPIPDTPMYSFILTPNVIQQIRKYNSGTNYDDFNLECETSTGNACVSEFLTSLINGNLNNAAFNSQPGGTCVTNPLTRVTNSTYFYGC